MDILTLDSFYAIPHIAPVKGPIDATTSARRAAVHPRSATPHVAIPVYMTAVIGLGVLTVVHAGMAAVRRR